MQTTWGQCSCLTTRNSLLWSAAVTDVLCVFVGFLAQSKNTQDQVKRSVTANHRYECEFEFEKTPSPRCRAAIIHAAFRSADNRVLRIIQKSTFSFIMASRKKKTWKISLTSVQTQMDKEKISSCASCQLQLQQKY